MKDDREFIPQPGRLGVWVKNPAFTGNKFVMHKHYKCKVLTPLNGIKKYMKLKECYVHRTVTGQLYISEVENGDVCFTEAEEGVHFNLIP